MKPLIYNYNAQAEYEQALCHALNGEPGRYEMRHFPDGETYVRVLDECQDRPAVIIASLHQPDSKFLPLAYLCETIKDIGATRVVLAVPYLPYMRQDIRFHPGEGITSRYFARLMSGLFDGLVTIDPHLHRYQSLDEIYSIPSLVARADDSIAAWIKANLEAPVIVGPDEESEQWVRQVANRVGCEVLVLRKTRFGDRDVKIEIPDIERYKDRTPVLVDDIISTGHTMLETAQSLVREGLKVPYCIGIHGVFSPGAYDAMSRSCMVNVVTGNTIPHPSNSIRLEAVLANATQQLCGTIFKLS